MLKKIQNFIFDNQLIQNDEKVLLAVSGGVDSMVLCHLFHQAKFEFGIAHCNFKLRESESDEDAIFVKKIAQTYQVPFFDIEFETNKYVKENKISVQVAARDLRYDWLEKIRSKNDFRYIATAHHLDDSLETILYNFTKGCGIRGLHGILPKKNKVIRPLLFSHKKEISHFAKKQKIAFREDASNATDKYARNNIRHHVIPVLESINPSLPKTITENIKRINETEQLFHYAISLLQKEITEQRKGHFYIHLGKLQASPAPSTLLFEILRPFNFNNNQIAQMIDSIEHQAGPIFFSSSHQVLLDRDFFIIKKNTPIFDQRFIINKNDTQITFPKGQLSLKIKSEKPNFSIKEKQIAYFDMEKIQFPLTLRKWKAGDYFHPIGMNGQRKKVKKFLTDLKLNRFEKEVIWVLESDGEICWVISNRMDERFKINEEVNSILEVRLKN
ncbi:MAG: tRNA lysidine(34) synthetase TilS [Saprospiraceae bacterium]|mgnify:CR=1 FL=1|nr:tRNA lysidine(34) synthetase TilS [Saprospiraceae bacterium]MDG2418417.1 tRNA lysidine(34) synthetase TilS [Saprospiraceae bacterium]